MNKAKQAYIPVFIFFVGALALLGCTPTPEPTLIPDATQVVQTAVGISVKQTLVASTPTAPAVTARALPTNVSTPSDNVSQVIGMAFSPDNRFIAVATACGHVIVYGLQTESGGIFKLDATKQDAMVQFASPPHTMAFSADSKILVLSSRGDSLDEICFAFNSMMPADADAKMVWPGMTSRSDSDIEGKIDISFRENGAWNVRENGVAAWGFASGPFVAPVHNIFPEGVNFVVEPDSDSVSLMARSDGHSYVWEIGTSEAVMSLGSEELNSIDATTTFNPDATLKAIASGQDIILKRTIDNQIWHVLRGGSNGGHQSQISAIMFSRDGNTFFSASKDGQVIVWGIDIAIRQHFPDSPPEDMPLIWNKFSLDPGITSLELNFDQSRLAIGYGNGSIKVASISGLNRP